LEAVKRLPAAAKTAVVGVPVLLVALVAAAWLIPSIDIPLVGEADSSTTGSSDVNESIREADADEAALRRCVLLWNKADNTAARNTLAVSEGEYVSVTLSAQYPDRCLVTIANPRLDLSAQLLESGSASAYPYDQIASGSASTLPQSVTHWNASPYGAEGGIALNSGREDPRF